MRVLDADRPGDTTDLTGELAQEIRGREIFFAVHGFNVNQEDGIADLGFWLDNVRVGNAIPIGVLWPGDSLSRFLWIMWSREARRYTPETSLRHFLTISFQLLSVSPLRPTRWGHELSCKQSQAYPRALGFGVA